MGLINYTNLQDNTPATANSLNERFGNVVEVINGGIDTTNIEPGGISVAAIANDVYSKIWPIGSVYINATNNTNPNELLGIGTWTEFGTGRVPVGYDASQTDFNAAEKTGGNNTHNHTLAAGAAMIGSPLGDSGRLGFKSSQNGDLSGSTYNVGASSSSTPNTRSHNTALTGTTDSTTSMPPYITVYMWKRVG